MLRAYHGEKKPWVIRAVSLFVILTFLVTQSDVQLAFANIATPSAAPSLPLTDLGKKDKIHFMQDLGQEQQDLQGQANQNPLNGISPEQNQQNPFSGDIPQGQTPPISTSFLLDQNPLLNKTEVGASTQEDPISHVVTVNYVDGTYFKYQKSSNKITEICDLTRPVLDDKGAVTGYALETRQFSYETTSKNGANVSYVRVITVGQGDQLSTYQKFTMLPDGQLDQLIETGYWFLNDSTDQYVQSVTTQYDGNRVTFYDRTSDPSFYIERVYEQLSSGENRLLSYQKIEGALASINLEVQYNDADGRVTVIDRSQSGPEASESVNFWEYKLTDGNKRGDLLAVGEMDAAGQVLSRMDIAAATYTITSPQLPSQLLIFERLENGGFGRVLRYRDNGIDLEYIYSKDDTGAEMVTILDYAANTFIKMSFVQGMEPNASSGVINSPQNVISAGTFSNEATLQLKELIKKEDGAWVVTDPEDQEIFQVYEAFPNGEIGRLLRDRGPPASDPTALVTYQYEYDTEQHFVYVYDLALSRYATYSWFEDQPPVLLNQGDFVQDPDGSLHREAPFKIYPAGAAESGTLPVVPFDTAYEVLNRSGASAVVVGALTSEDLDRLLLLNKQVGVAVYHGQIILFTDGSSDTLRVPLAVNQTILEDASLFLRIQPLKGTGPSAEDVAMAAGDPPGTIRYVVTNGGLYTYTSEGILAQDSSLTGVVQKIADAQKELNTAPPENVTTLVMPK
ncbi:MAG: hypothetical protein PHV97_08230, partial [Candidatus Omnitrophica bacterium]|nr:hypothetical protein [Candidatus Omnitrophota bacterium]